MTTAATKTPKATTQKTTADPRTKQLENLLQTAELKCLEALNIGILVVEVNFDNISQHRFLTSNQAAHKMAQTDFSQYHGKTMAEATPGLLATQLPTLYRQAAQTQTPVDCGEISYGDDNIPDAVFTVKAIPIGANIVAACFENLSYHKTPLDSTLNRATNKLIDELQIGISIIEVDRNNPANHRHITTNQAADILTETDTRQYHNTTFQESTPSLLNTQIPSALTHAVESQHSVDFNDVSYGDTQAKQTKLAFDAQTNVFNAILENNTIMASLIDTQGIYRRSYGNWEAQLGIMGRDLAGKATTEFFPQHQQGFHKAKLGKTIQFSIINDSKNSYHAFQNTLIPYHQGGILHIAFDITELKRTEQALRLSQERFKAALKNTNIVVYNQDTKLRYTWIFNCHPSLSYEAMYLKNDREIFPAEEAKIFNTIKQKVLDTGIGTQADVQTTIDGKKTFQSMAVEPLYDIEGRISGVTCVVIDITKQKLRERQRRQYLAEKERHRHQLDLAHITRVTTMGEMATNIAHEVNQPLASISGYTHGCIQRLRTNSISQDQLLTALRQIETQTQRAGNIIRRQLEFVRKKPLKKSPHQVNHLINDALDFMKLDIEKYKTTVSLSLCKENPVVKVDKIQVEQVLINLIKNALEAMGATKDRTSQLSIKTETDTITPHTIITITDNGPGIPEGMQDQLFQQYFTTKKAGVGMGLAISRTIIESHGGTIKLSSDTNTSTGVCAKIKLPTSQGSRES